MPVLFTGRGGMVEGLICSHGGVQSSCFAGKVLGTLSWPQMSLGRLRGTVLVRCALCVRREGVPADVCYTEKATPARHRPERQHNARSNRRKQCSLNEPADVWCVR